MFLLEYGQKTFKNLTQMLGIRTQKWSRWGILLFLFILFLFARVEMCVLLCFHATDLVFVKHFVMLKWLDQYEKGIQCKIARMLGTSSRALFCKCLIWNYEISSLCSRKSRLVECTNNWYGSLCNIWVNVSFTYIFFPPTLWFCDNNLKCIRNRVFSRRPTRSECSKIHPIWNILDPLNWNGYDTWTDASFLVLLDSNENELQTMYEDQYIFPRIIWQNCFWHERDPSRDSIS